MHLKLSRFSCLESEYVMLDANFRLKLKQRNLDDPPLGGGLAYYVDGEKYMAHIEASGPQTEVRDWPNNVET